MPIRASCPPAMMPGRTAKERARINQASLILGSATPSLESYTKAVLGEYILLKLTRRAKASAALPQAEIVDLREELKAGNRSIFSRRLKELMEDRLKKESRPCFLSTAAAMQILYPAVPAERLSAVPTAM